VVRERCYGYKHRIKRRQGVRAAVLSCLALLLLAGCAILPNEQGGSGQLKVQQAPKTRLTYVAIGASDTFGIGTDDPETESWPADLTAKLGNGVRLINLGIPGIDAHEALTSELPVAIDAHPDLVTVWLAVNDIADNVPLNSYAHDLDLLLSRLQAGAPHAKIVVANVPDLTLLPHFQSYDLHALRDQIDAYNNAINSIVARHHVLLVDLFRLWQELAEHPEYISSDGFHPNDIGYMRLAELFYQVLRQNGI
jgi:lysophospholipase L1-like esterase